MTPPLQFCQRTKLSAGVYAAASTRHKIHKTRGLHRGFHKTKFELEVGVSICFVFSQILV
jgi:hypothetical protein